MSVTFLTGASSGIGRSLALRLALQGETIAAVARRKLLLDTLVEEIAQAGGRALAVPCDVTDHARVFAAVEETQTVLGPIDRLIANAGGGEPTFVETFDAAHIQRVLALNVEGTANCIEAVLPAMLQRGAGHIVAVSSLAAYSRFAERGGLLSRQGGVVKHDGEFAHRPEASRDRGHAHLSRFCSHSFVNKAKAETVPARG